MSVIGSIASGKRDISTQEKIYRIAQAKTNILVWLRRNNLVDLLLEPIECQTILARIFYTWPDKWTEQEQNYVTKLAVDKAYGDPLLLRKHKLELKPYTVQFFNPLGIELNIKPMGIGIDKVAPGDVVSIPAGYCVGGSKSVLASTAPQLKPMPPQERDYLIDNSPISYTEWVSYLCLQVSECCGHQILWSETEQNLVCQKCFCDVRLVHD